MQRRTTIAFCALALLASACGTTRVHRAGAGVLTTDNSFGGLAQTTAPGALPVAGTTLPSDLAQVTSPGSAPVADGFFADTPLDGATAGGGSTLAPRSTSVQVGIEYIDAGGATAAAGAIGVKGISSADEKAAYQVLFDELNRHGGLAGHRVKAVFASYNPAGSDPATQEQAMCSRFTQDNKVVAALIVPTASANARGCLTKKGVATIARGLSAIVDDRVFAASPLFATSGTLSLDRFAKVYIDGLQQQGYFGKKPVIGLVTADESSFTHTADGPLRAALRSYGFTVKVEQRVPTAYTVANYGGAAPSVQNAVLRFRAAGVTHVLFLQPTGASALLFMLSANQQNYTPRYGMSTNDQLQNVAGQVGASQLKGALAVGWYPTSDVPTSTFPLAPEAKRCLALFAKHGIQGGEQSAQSGLLGICDSVNVLAGATQLSGILDARSIMAAIGRLASSVTSAAYLRLTYTRAHHDGVSLAAGAAYQVDCSCFKYGSQRFTP